MILDRLENSSLYRNLGPRLARAFDYLQSTDFSKVEPGRYELDGTHVYAMVQVYRTRPLAQITWEAHRRYLDVQYIVRGDERMGWTSPGSHLTVTRPYTPESDAELYQGAGQLIEYTAGTFAIYYPTDVHAPGLVAASGIVGEVQKVVVKCEV